MNKTTIAIIDDESLVRVGIKSSVSWEEHGYEIVGEADNGQSGLEMILEKKPDIVFLDVCMPVMDGIEVLRQLKKENLDCTVIVLSCHDDFHYVREAMKNGACDYLRKNEINSANILRVLEEIRRSVQEKKDVESEAGQQGWEKYYSRQACLQQLITGPGRDGELPLPTDQLAIHESHLICAVFSVADYQQILERYETGYPFTLEHSVINLTKEVVRQRSREAEIFLQQENIYVLLLSSRSSTRNSEWESQVFSMLSELCTVLQDYLNARIFCGVSSTVSQFSCLPEAFSLANYSRKLHYFQPDKSIIKEARLPADTLEEPAIKEFTGQINTAISKKQYSQAFEHLEAVFQWLSEHSRENLDVTGIRGSFVNMARYILLQEGKNSEELLSRLTRCETLLQTKEFFQDFQNDLEDSGEDLAQRHYLIRAATEYIQENLSRGNISLDEIAEHLLISKSYLCRLFQKNMGLSVQRYIHNIRIERAKEYLKDYHLKIYEIAELTGFNSSTHFNIVFKKIVHCTPIEYRNGYRSDEKK